MLRSLPASLTTLVQQNYRNYLRPLTILFVLIVSVLIAPRIAQGNRLLGILLIAYFGLMGFLTLMRWPGLGFIGLVFASMVIPFSIGTGSQSALNAAVLVVCLLIGLWIVDMLVVKRKIRLINSRTLLPAFLFIGAAILSLGFGQLNWFPIQGAPLSAQIGGMAIFVLLVGAFLVTAHQVKSISILEWMVWSFLLIGTIFLVGYFLPSLGILDHLFNLRAVIDNQFWVWLVTLAFSQAMFNQRLRLPLRLALGGIVLATLYILLVHKQEWVSGWLPSVISIIVMIWIAKPRLGLFASVVGGILVLINQQNALGFASAGGDNDYSLSTRMDAWIILLKIILQNPIFGLGPANYYQYTAIFSIRGYNVAFNSHNNYFDIMAQTGLVGLASFIWLFLEIGRVAWGTLKIAPEGFPKAYVFGILGGLCATLASAMLGDWVVPFVYNVGIDGFRASVLGWMYLGGMVALDQILRRPEPHDVR